MWFHTLGAASHFSLLLLKAKGLTRIKDMRNSQVVAHLCSGPQKMKLFLYSGCQKFFGRGDLKCPMFFLILWFVAWILLLKFTLSHLCFVAWIYFRTCSWTHLGFLDLQEILGFQSCAQHLDLQAWCRKQRLCLIIALPEVYTGFSCALFLFFHPFKVAGTQSCLTLWKTLRSSVAEGVSPSCAYLFREIKV